MEGQPEEVQDQYQIMEGNVAPTPTPAPAPTPTPVPEQKAFESPVYSNVQDNVAPAAPVPPVAPAAPVPQQQPQVPLARQNDPNFNEQLVAVFSITRFMAAVSLISGAGNMYSENPGTNYIMAGIFLFASNIGEFLAELIDKITFGISMVASIIIVVGGVLSIDRNDINLDTIGILWSIASFLLAGAHTYDVVKSYGRVNIIITVSKISATIGSTLFLVAGLIMFSLDEPQVEDIWKFANFFSSGGMCYMVHAILMASGHKAVLNRAFNTDLYQQPNQSPGLQMV